MPQPLVTVFGGSGFIGRHLVARLAADGARVRVAVRRPNDAVFLKPMGDVGQIQIVQANVRHEASVAAAVAGADSVVNLVGILHESGRQRFAAIHAEGAGAVARAAARAGVKRLVQISAIGAEPAAKSRYARTKAAGEEAVRAAFPKATILRPSVVFGPEDDFFNRFAELATFSPVLPLIGGGGTRFQPVYAGDVAGAILSALRDPAAAGRVYELGGPRVYTFRELMDVVLSETGRARTLVPVPAAFAKLAAWFLQLAPRPLLTVDQVRLLARDNVASALAPGLQSLGVRPTSIEAIVPTYLWRFRRTGQFANELG